MSSESTADVVATFLDDPERVRIWIPEEDDARWDDPEDHGDPKIERWARALGQVGTDIAVAATIACADVIALVWRIDVGTSTIDDAVAAARSRLLIDAALSRLTIDKALVHRAHTSDAWAAARCALIAARDPTRAADELQRAALYAYRVVGWSTSRVTPGENALCDQLAQFGSAGIDHADSCRKTLRRALRASLVSSPHDQ